MSPESIPLTGGGGGCNAPRAVPRLPARERLLRESLRVLLRAVLASLGGLRVYGLENVPESGGVIVAPNHVSHLDPIIVGVTVRRPVWFLATDELFAIPVLGPLSRYLRAFPIRQDSPDRRALARAHQLLLEGEVLVVFPEGHESLDGRLQELQGGVVLLAERARVPVVPVGIRGSDRILPPREWRPRHGGEPVIVRFGRAMDLTSDADLMRGRAGRDIALARLAAELRRLSGQVQESFEA